MGKKHAAGGGGGGGWFAAVRKVFRPSWASSSAATTSSKDKDKDAALQHGKQVGAPHPPMLFTVLTSTILDELASTSIGWQLACHAMPWCCERAIVIFMASESFRA
jgi:hypothetical protein